MDAVNEAMKVLKQVSLKEKEKGLSERVESLTTTLRLLDISLSTDSQIFEKLVAAVRQPFIPLYEKFPLQTLQLSAAIFSFLFHEKIVMQLTAGNKSLQSSWEGVAESLLSGVLDFLERRSDGVTLRTLASALYPVLCRICFSTAFCSSITMGSTLRYTAFTLLVDSANEPANKEVLRNPEYLGSRRLGATLYGSKDYVILENLLLLVLIVAPKFEFMVKRSAFMREVFVTNYPEDAVSGENLAKVLTKPTERDSDLLQAQAIDILAQSNLMFPQPFEVTQIDSCDLRFPQKPPQQRLIVDYKSLLANVIKDEGYESFRVSFDQIRGISFSTIDQKPLVKVVVQTSSAPEIQSRPLKVPDGQSPYVMFEIKKGDVLRFKRALRSRGIAVTPHISVSQEGHRLEFDKEGNPVPEILASVRKVQTIERVMQLSQRSDDSPGDKDDQDHEYRLTVNESLGSPLVRFARPPINIPQDAAAATSSGSVSAPSRALPDLLVSQKTQTTTTKSTAAMSTKKPADVTPRPKVPRQPSALVPATPSQNRVLHKDAFGSDGTDLSELSDDSEADSMKALSQKVAARTGSLVAVTKHASVLADAVPSAGVSGKKTAKRRVLDSEEEQVLSNSRKGAKGGSKPGVRKPKKALPTVVASDVEDDVPPAPAPLKRGRPKATKKNPEPLDEKKKPLVRDKIASKRKREDKDDGVETGEISDVQEKPPPVKRARKTAGGKPGATKPKAVSPAPPSPPRDSQVLKKARPAAKKNANYGGRTKAPRISPPARDSAALSDGDDAPDTLDLTTGPVDPRVEPPLVDDSGDAPPVSSKSKPKSKAAAKPKSSLVEQTIIPETSKTTTVKTKAKNKAGARTRVAVAKAKDVDDEKIVKVGPYTTKEKGKWKMEVLSADEGEDREEGEEGGGKVDLTKESPVAIEVSSSSPEPPQAILPKRGPVSRVIPQEEHVTDGPSRAEKLTKARSAPAEVARPQGRGASRVEEMAVEPMEVIAIPVPSPVRSTSTEKRTEMPTLPIPGQVFTMRAERKEDDRASESAKIEWQPTEELWAANDSRLVEANLLIAVSGGVDDVVGVEAEVVNEMVATSVQGLYDIDIEPGRFDPIVAKSPMRTPTSGITKASPVRTRERVEPEESCPLEMNPDNGESSEDGIHAFMPPQPIIHRMPVGVSTPRERLGTGAGMNVTAQSTPATLPRGSQQVGQMTSRKVKVTFAATPFEERELARVIQNEATPRNGAQRRRIFEEDAFGTNNARKRTPAKNSNKHSALVEVLDEIQDVIVKKITHQFEVAEEEARFVRNDVHNEALNDFKKMHSQRAVQFNALVDLETAYATRERELVAAYKATLAVNAEILDHVRQKIREHDERNLAGMFPKTLRRNPMSALMESYLK